MTMKRIGLVLKGLAVLVTLFLIDQWVFSKLFGLNYWRWYLTNGALISLVSPIAFKAWGDLADKHIGLLSPNPYIYLAACVQVVGLPVYSLGTQLVKQKKPANMTTPIDDLETRRKRLSIFDLLVTFLWIPIMLAAILLWFVIVAPLQYIVHLVCGAPARFMVNSDRVPIARLAGSQLHAGEVSRKETQPAGWEDASISRRPFSLTNMLAAILLWALRSFVA